SRKLIRVVRWPRYSVPLSGALEPRGGALRRGASSRVVVNNFVNLKSAESIPPWLGSSLSVLQALASLRGLGVDPVRLTLRCFGGSVRRRATIRATDRRPTGGLAA